MNTIHNDFTQNVFLFFVTILLMFVSTSCDAQVLPKIEKIPSATPISINCSSSNPTQQNATEWQGNELHKAVIQLDLSSVKKLLKKKIDVNEKDNFGNSPLHNALSPRISEPMQNPREMIIRKKQAKAQLEITRLLVKHRADVNARGFDAKTPLILSVTLDESIVNKVVNLLVQNNANINLQDNQGFTALIEASRTNRINILEFLLKNGADKNLKGCDENTALSLAQQYKFASIIKALN